MLNGVLIDPEYCSGCHSCEIACRTEKGLTLDQYGIKLCEVGPFVVDEAQDRFIWNFHPLVSDLCDTCTDRRETGEKAACELCCLADAIVVGPVDDLFRRMKEKSAKMSLLVP